MELAGSKEVSLFLPLGLQPHPKADRYTLNVLQWPCCVLLGIWTGNGKCSVLVWASITNYYRLSGLNIYFLQFWRL